MSNEIFTDKFMPAILRIRDPDDDEVELQNQQVAIQVYQQPYDRKPYEMDDNRISNEEIRLDKVETEVMVNHPGQEV